jgi:aryl-alcohol dehydrogenase-like predicted oxidoreductase
LRLQTDYLDLYQLHWPERKPIFLDKEVLKSRGRMGIIHAVLDTLGDFIKEGKIKHIGLSNETPWGIMRFLEESKPSFAKNKTVQNHILY